MTAQWFVQHLFNILPILVYDSINTGLTEITILENISDLGPENLRYFCTMFFQSVWYEVPKPKFEVSFSYLLSSYVIV